MRPAQTCGKRGNLRGNLEERGNLRGNLRRPAEEERREFAETCADLGRRAEALCEETGHHGADGHVPAYRIRIIADGHVPADRTRIIADEHMRGH